MKYCCNDNKGDNQSTGRKTCQRATSSTTKTHMVYPGIETGPSRCEASDCRLSHGTAYREREESSRNGRERE